MCGIKMEEMDEETKKEWMFETKGEDKAEYYFCDQCCLPRTFHHPIYGITSKAGDSWSVSFVN